MRQIMISPRKYYLNLNSVREIVRSHTGIQVTSELDKIIMEKERFYLLEHTLRGFEAFEVAMEAVDFYVGKGWRYAIDED